VSPRRQLSPGNSRLLVLSGGAGTSLDAAAERFFPGVDLQVVDVSRVVSRYIGETEKNLARVFERAERSGAVLAFDEADALFGRRATVKDSHDRYANLEVSHLLGRLGEYPGVPAVVVRTGRRPLKLPRGVKVIDLDDVE
jgi:SpoVK/Ycf46/Vps4 family AAA+-type ATPase